MHASTSSSTSTPTPAEGFEQTAPLPWSGVELALFALFGAFIVAGVLLVLVASFW